MPTDKAKVNEYLNAALLQLGAESYLHELDSFAIQADVVDRWKYGFNDPTHPFIDPRKGGRAAADPNDPVPS